MRSRTLILGFSLVIAVILADQLSKWVILMWVMQPPQIFEITPFFDLVLVFNRGVSFGFLNSAPEFTVYFLITLTVLISLVLVIWLIRVTTPLLSSGIGLILGGALGNLIDRFRFGAVVDFLHFHWNAYSFPAFNIADTAITLGVIAILIDSFYTDKGTQK